VMNIIEKNGQLESARKNGKAKKVHHA
jgi:hypothetical protein